mmetsp:Transcript_64720/g.75969  ORF Transcript_64720/g.75969 Transcript_64720/m.75969 type:complete len:126 (-) Transcript_64720:369-746(-)
MPNIENKHWVLIDERDVPKGVKIIPSVWAMKGKRDITTRAILKYKARLNVHGGKYEHGVNYNQTYSPVVGWWIIRLFFTLVLLHSWKTRQVDFVLAYSTSAHQSNNSRRQDASKHGSNKYTSNQF